MSRFRGRNRDEAAALDARLDGTGPDDAVSGLLAAARAPETAAPDGLAAAVAAFRRGDPPRRERRTGQVWRRVLATTLTTKIVAGASVAVAAAGITVASEHDRTPAPRRAPVPSVSGSEPGGSSDRSEPGSDRPSSRSATPSSSAVRTSPGTGRTTSGSATTSTATGSPSPSTSITSIRPSGGASRPTQPGESSSTDGTGTGKPKRPPVPPSSP